MTEEQRSPTGKPMTPATPMDVIHFRLGSYALVFCFALGVLSVFTRLWWLTGLSVIGFVFVVTDIVLAYRRQDSLGRGTRSEG
ncbi:hypothetical protein [Acrocarpospora catenulata]|uniref:hypothetical protein n=1 Tax=Acrocarpospora catenulata TaxID=2836182 RepID=UPI001BD9E4DE|nr:hypothetical protein [Acrocarpospora catenulata]